MPQKLFSVDINSNYINYDQNVVYTIKCPPDHIINPTSLVDPIYNNLTRTLCILGDEI